MSAEDQPERERLHGFDEQFAAIDIAMLRYSGSAAVGYHDQDQVFMLWSDLCDRVSASVDVPVCSALADAKIKDIYFGSTTERRLPLSVAPVELIATYGPLIVDEPADGNEEQLAKLLSACARNIHLQGMSASTARFEVSRELDRVMKMKTAGQWWHSAFRIKRAAKIAGLEYHPARSRISLLAAKVLASVNTD